MAKKSFADYAGTQSWDTKGFDPVPDGDFKVQLMKCEIKQSAESQHWMMCPQMKILEGDSAGQMIFSNLMFEGKNGWNPFNPKKFFEGLELELPEFDEMEDSIEELVENDTIMDVNLKTSGSGFQNLTTMGIDEDYEPGEEGDESDGEEDDSSEDEDDEEGYTADDINEMKKDELLEFIEENELEYEGKETPKAMKKFIIEYLESQEESDEDDSEEDEDDDGEDDENHSALVEFCQAYGMDVNDDMSVAEMVAYIEEEEFEFEADQLEEDEVTLLTEVGLEDSINEEE